MDHDNSTDVRIDDDVKAALDQINRENSGKRQVYNDIIREMVEENTGRTIRSWPMNTETPRRRFVNGLRNSSKSVAKNSLFLMGPCCLSRTQRYSSSSSTVVAASLTFCFIRRWYSSTVDLDRPNRSAIF